MKRSSATRLVEPDFWTCPHGERARPKKVQTFGPEVAELCAEANFAPDPQQELGLDLIFAFRPDGTPETFSFCVICCRQNLKSGLFTQAVLGWLYVLDIPEIVWSAHEMSTTRDAQKLIGRLMTDSSRLRRRMKIQKNDGIYNENGEERIELATGQTVMFKARSENAGRGLSKPRLVLDEAFALTPAMMGALLPTLLAMPTAQVLYGSSAGKKNSTVLHDLRERGRAGASPMMTYLEWCSERVACEDPECRHPKSGAVGCALDRVDLWEKANPTLSTGRITLERIANMRQDLMPEEFMRECLGWWDELNLTGYVFGEGNWEKCQLDEAVESPPPISAFGIGVSLGADWASIAASRILDDDRILVGAVDRREGTAYLPKRVKQLQDDHGCPVLIDEKCPDAALVKNLREAGVDLTVLKFDQIAEAHSELKNRVKTRELVHEAHLELDDAVAAAAWRPAGDRQVLGRKPSSGHIDMLEAAALAHAGALDELSCPIEDTYL